jgi:hypothetical protein
VNWLLNLGDAISAPFWPFGICQEGAVIARMADAPSRDLLIAYMSLPANI